MPANIVSIKLKAGEHELELTEHEARDLYYALHNIYGQRNVHVPQIPWRYYEPYTQPLITWGTTTVYLTGSLEGAAKDIWY
jgi:hypothetical protein